MKCNKNSILWEMQSDIYVRARRSFDQKMSLHRQSIKKSSISWSMNLMTAECIWIPQIPNKKHTMITNFKSDLKINKLFEDKTWQIYNWNHSQHALSRVSIDSSSSSQAVGSSDTWSWIFAETSLSSQVDPHNSRVAFDAIAWRPESGVYSTRSLTPGTRKWLLFHQLCVNLNSR